MARKLTLGGIVVVVVSMSQFHARMIADPPYSYTGTFRFGFSILYIGLLMVMAYGSGLPELPGSPRAAASTAVVVAMCSALAISALQLFLGDALLPRFVVFGSGLLLIPWFVACSGLAAGGGGGRAMRKDRVLLIGDHLTLGQARREFQSSPERPVSVVGVLRIEDARATGDGTLVLVERAIAGRATLVVLDHEAQADPAIVRQVAQLHESGLRVRTLSLFYEEWLGKLPISELQRVSLMFDIGEVHRARYGRIKRMLDVAIASAALPVLVLLFPAVWVINKAANPGPMFFRQERAGKNGQAFKIHKFRTMVPTEISNIPSEWTSESDPRITPFGRILRRSHLDELPQLIDILKGDLAIVGPRPEQSHYVNELVDKIPFYGLRHLVRPGLTGWAQVKYRYGADEADALEKLQYDFFYLRHQRLSLDVRIIGRTIRSVLGRGGR